MTKKHNAKRGDCMVNEWLKCGLCGEEGTKEEIEQHVCENDIEVATWFERDRAYVIVYKDDSREESIIEWWDEKVSEAVDNGDLNPRDWRGSAIEYCKEVGLIK